MIHDEERIKDFLDKINKSKILKDLEFILDGVNVKVKDKTKILFFFLEFDDFMDLTYRIKLLLEMNSINLTDDDYNKIKEIENTLKKVQNIKLV